MGHNARVFQPYGLMLVLLCTSTLADICVQPRKAHSCWKWNSGYAISNCGSTVAN